MVKDEKACIRARLTSVVENRSRLPQEQAIECWLNMVSVVPASGEIAAAILAL
jgi:hypothetical protein